MGICSKQTVHQSNIDTKNLVLVLTIKRGRKGSHSQFLRTNYYPHQNNLKLALDILFSYQT